MKPKQFLLSTVTLAVLLLLPATVAKADPLTIIFNATTQSGIPGSLLTFVGTITNPTTNTSLISIGSDAIDITGSNGFVINDLFLTNGPAFLDPGQSFTGNLFEITVNNTTSPGLYPGTFSIFDNDQALVGHASFNVNVTTSTVPEPATLWLLGTGFISLSAAMRRRRKTRKHNEGV